MSISREPYRLAAWGVLLALAGWLLSPALHPVHVEGFSASIVALGLHLADGSLAAFFPSQPLNTEYFGLTKLGAVLTVAGLVKLGFGGETAMRLSLAFGWVLLIYGSARLARHWSGASWLMICAVLLLLPGVADSAFFFNDNVLGAGLIVAALAIFCDRQGRGAAVLVGVMMGLAITVRTDLVLVGPAVFLLAAERQPLARAAASTAAVAAAALVTLWLTYAAVGASPLNAVRAGALAVEMWARPLDPWAQARALLFFLGLPGLILCLFGIMGQFATGGRLRWAALVGMPVLMNLALFGRIWEARQLLPLTPFLAALAALGGQRLLAEWRAGIRIPPALTAAGLAAILFAPPAIVYFSDGPRVVLGRVAAIRDWNGWQAQVRGNFALIDRTIAAARPGQTLAIVTDYWDEDRYLHLRLMEQGFHAGPEPDNCAKVGQAMTSNDRRIVQVSLHRTFVPNADSLAGQVLSELVAPCLRALQAPAVLIAHSDLVARLHRSEDRGPPTIRPRRVQLAAIALSPFVLERLAGAYQAQSRVRRRGWNPTLAEAIHATRARTSFVP